MRAINPLRVVIVACIAVLAALPFALRATATPTPTAAPITSAPAPLHPTAQPTSPPTPEAPSPGPSGAPVAIPVDSPPTGSGPDWDQPLPPDPPDGWLTVPSLRLDRVPIYTRGLDAAREMVIAPGMSVTHYRFSDSAGGSSNTVLYAHEGGVFAHLSWLGAGAEVDLTRSDGVVFRYRTAAPRAVSPGDVSILNGTSSPMLTLFTCQGYADQLRTVVTATPA